MSGTINHLCCFIINNIINNINNIALKLPSQIHQGIVLNQLKAIFPGEVIL